MEEKNWLTALVAAYQSQHGIIQPPSTNDEDITGLSHPRPQIPVDEEEEVFNFLENTKLLERLGTHNYRLTYDGFTIAHDYRIEQQRQDISVSQKEATDTLANFTVILGAAALIQALAAVISVEKYRLVLLLIYLLVLIVLYATQSRLHD